MKVKVLVTGSKGQLGQSIQSISHKFKTIEFTFLDSKTLDITNEVEVTTFFKSQDFSYCINCAAYTAVDKAEEEKEKAYSVNVEGSKNIAEACLNYNVVLLHVSTDFVFDGNTKTPYIETDQTNPLSVYGKTKLEGEQVISQILNQYFIVRTSWLYSEFGGNFVITMLRLAQTRDELSVVNDQIGTPTYAKDLASFLLKLISEEKRDFGIYHFSNEGEISWFDFAKSIFKLSHSKIKINSIPSSEFPTPAQRPKYSVLSKKKIKDTFNYKPINWDVSLKACIDIIKNNHDS